MRKIALVSEYFYPHLGGITEHVYHYAKQLLARGFEVTLFTGYEGEPPGVPLPEGLRLVHLGKSIPIFANNSFAKVTLGWNLGKKVQQALDEGQFDLVHIHSATSPVLPVLFQKYSQTITIGTFHTYFDSSLFYRLLRGLTQRYIDALDGIIAVAPSCIDALSRYFTFKNGYRIIPNGVDVEWFGTPSGQLDKFNDQRPTILFLGRLDPRNGLDTLIAAFSLVLTRLPDARLVIIGDGPLRALYEQQAAPLINHSIFFEGQVNKLRPDYFDRCDVFCYPATKASFGVTLLEAMAANRPVVATDNCGFRELIRSGEDGLLAQPDSPQDLAETLIRVLSDRNFARTLAKNARQKVEGFSWTAVTDQVLAYYDHVYSLKRGESFAR